MEGSDKKSKKMHALKEGSIKRNKDASAGGRSRPSSAGNKQEISVKLEEGQHAIKKENSSKGNSPQPDDARSPNVIRGKKPDVLSSSPLPSRSAVTRLGTPSASPLPRRHSKLFPLVANSSAVRRHLEGSFDSPPRGGGGGGSKPESFTAEDQSDVSMDGGAWSGGGAGGRAGGGGGVDSSRSSPSGSVGSSSFAGFSADSLQRRYKNELWSAIKSDYQYLMDEEMIETCKSTESDLSVVSEPGGSSSAQAGASDTASFKSFIELYIQLTDWLCHMLQRTPRKGATRSEYYLHQMYHEELAERGSSRAALVDMARGLARRHPQMSEELETRLARVHSQWEELEALLLPFQGVKDGAEVLRDVEADLVALSRWVHEMEAGLQPLRIQADWTVDELKQKLCEQKVLQADIEHHSKVVSSILALCDRLSESSTVQGSAPMGPAPQGLMLSAPLDALRDRAQGVALEKRCHALWILSLEWQLRLEDTLKNGPPRERNLSETTDDDQWDISMFTDQSHCIDNFDDSSIGVQDRRLGGAFYPGRSSANADKSGFYLNNSASEAETGGSDINCGDDSFDSGGGNNSASSEGKNSASSVAGNKSAGSSSSEGSKNKNGSRPSEAIMIVRRSTTERENDADSALGRSFSDPSLSESLSAGGAGCSGSGAGGRRKTYAERARLAGSYEMIGDVKSKRCEEGDGSVNGREVSGSLRRAEAIDLVASCERQVETGSELADDSGKLRNTESLDLFTSPDAANVLPSKCKASEIYLPEDECSTEIRNQDGVGTIPDIASIPMKEILSTPPTITLTHPNGGRMILDGRITEEDESADLDASVSDLASVADCGSCDPVDPYCERVTPRTHDSASSDWTRGQRDGRTEDEMSESMDLPLDDVPVVVYAPGALGAIAVAMSRSLDSLATASDERFLGRVDRKGTAGRGMARDLSSSRNQDQGARAERPASGENYRARGNSPAYAGPDGCHLAFIDHETLDVGNSARKTFSDVGVGSSGVVIRRGPARRGTRSRNLPPSSCDASSEATSSGSEWTDDDHWHRTQHRRRCYAVKPEQSSGLEFRVHNSLSDLSGSEGNSGSEVGDVLNSPKRGSPTSDVERSKFAMKRTRIRDEEAASSSGTECDDGGFPSGGNSDEGEGAAAKLRRTSPPSSPTSRGVKFGEGVKKLRRRRLQLCPVSMRGEQVGWKEEMEDGMGGEDGVKMMPVGEGEMRSVELARASSEWSLDGEGMWSAVDDSQVIYTNEDEKAESGLSADEWHAPQDCAELTNDATNGALDGVEGVVDDTESCVTQVLRVVKESRGELEVVESSLAEMNGDHVRGTRVHDPVEFSQPLVACDTHIARLLSLVEKLESSEGGHNIDVDSALLLKGLIGRWEELRVVTLTQQAEACSLRDLYAQLFDLERSLGQLTAGLNVEIDQFDGFEDLQQTIKLIQPVQAELTGPIARQLESLERDRAQFALRHAGPALCSVTEHVCNVRQAANILTLQCQEDVTRLYAVQRAWCTFTDTRAELDEALAQAAHQLDCITASVSNSPSSEEHEETVAALEAISHGCPTHAEKLVALELHLSTLTPACSPRALSDLSQTMEGTRRDLSALEAKCHDVEVRLGMEGGVKGGDVIQWSAKEGHARHVVDSAGVKSGTLRLIGASLPSPVLPPTIPSSIKMAAAPREPNRGRYSSLLRRLLKYALPLPLALALVLGGLYALDTEGVGEALRAYGMVLHPDLHHVRGPPPT